MDQNLSKTFEQVCRTCLADNVPLRSVFEAEIFDDYTVRMVDFIRNLTSIKIARGDGLPENFCITCVEQMCKTYTFIKRCIAVDTKLHEQYSNRLLSSRLQTNEDCTSKCSDDAAQTNEVSADSDFEVIKEESMLAVEQNNKHHMCGICSKSFESKDELAKHSIIHNTSLTLLYQCHICLKQFNKKTVLSSHIIDSHTEDKNSFACLQCDQKFAYLYQLKQHKFKHTKDKPYPCTKCDKGCLTAESLRRHLKVHDVSTKRYFACDICGKEFLYPSFLAEHSKMHTGEKPFLCSFCGKGFRQNGALVYHIRVHTGYKPHKCQICDADFSAKSALKSHMRRHTNERPFVCDVCGMAFRQSADMKSHHRTHTGGKRILCTLCGRYMSTTGQLTVHLRSHTGEKPFECDICTKSFTTRVLLIKHRRIHTGEKPYVCKICGRAFNQNGSLKSHGLTHTKKSIQDAGNTNISDSATGVKGMSSH